ncbi:MAG: transcription termination/antitermination protein NusA [Deltaproteobacteria bacterium]|nr:transcription termination/antitermination protein NusA [Deltaproteobacteria bacterium]
MFLELDRTLDQIARDKGITKERLIEAIEQAFLSAARKKWGHLGELEAHYNQEAGEIELFQFKTVVEKVQDPNIEITLEEGKELDPEAQAGDSLGVKMDSSEFGRIAAQAAKQVIIQKVRDAERDIIYSEYKDRVGELVTGVVRRFERGDMIIDLGRAEGCIPRFEQVPGEQSKVGERLQAYFMEINPNARGSMIVLSRRHPQLVKKLFEQESPEVSDGTVEIKNVAREPGVRTKIAVASKDSDVDPVGACVGVKGSRVQSVVQELKGEKIDIVSWDEDPARFVCNAIAPAEVVKVILKERERSMEVVVPDDQLSLAIGKRGQNVRLAAHLTGWNVDVFSEARYEEMASRCKAVLVKVLEVDESSALILYSHGFRHFEDIPKVGWEAFKEVPGIGKEKLQNAYEKAKKALEEGLTTEKMMGEMFKEDQGLGTRDQGLGEKKEDKGPGTKEDQGPGEKEKE